MEGHIKLYRTILESQVFAHPTSLKIWVWCLVKASYKDRFVPLKIGRGVTSVRILPGQFVFGRNKAQDELGIDGSTIYKWMQKFASDAFENMISLNSNNQYTIVTLSNWSHYQSREEQEVTTEEQPSNSQVTAEEQRSNTNKKDKKDNKDKNISPTWREDFEIYKKEAEEPKQEPKPKKSKDEILLESLETDEGFDVLFLQWLEYKRERGESYKGTKSAQLAYNRLVEMSARDKIRAKEIIDFSMSSNYAGLFESKTTKPNGNRHQQVSCVPGDYQGRTTL